MFGLGKKRSKFGKWLDKQGLTQREVEKAARINKNTMSLLCNDRDYSPKYSTWAKVEKALRKEGYNVDYDDFWM